MNWFPFFSWGSSGDKEAATGSEGGRLTEQGAGPGRVHRTRPSSEAVTSKHCGGALSQRQRDASFQVKSSGRQVGSAESGGGQVFPLPAASEGVQGSGSCSM